ncbi:hypothetical protein L3Y34_005612 [Caenorhabditis briggsae]|uniref:Complex I assembly factor TIMMDC1, mitochondrial n=1 Tax=Caenorhabditis briggsae TaxID=6238 RepID=A0AAE9AHX8_CAEBR|nr:hypothetical protein L3Y34_005612 [Caenorhabditis briggsae]
MTEQQKKQNSEIGWWEWLGWKGSPPSATTSTPIAIEHLAEPTPSPEAVPTTSVAAIVAPKVVDSVEVVPKTGWDRVMAIYERENAMEKDATIRVVRMSFLGGFLVGGATGYAQARHAYETNNVGRKYLSPSDAVKRKIDYAIVRFAKGGFGTGFKCALITGSIVFLTTHVTAYRDKFSSWYFPTTSVAAIVAPKVVDSVEVVPKTGWDRVMAIYERENAMEKDATIRVGKVLEFH